MKEMQDNGLAQIEKEMEPVETRPYTGLIDRYGNRVYLGDVVSVPDVFDYKCGAREFKHNKAVVVRSGNEYGLSCFEKKGKLEERLRSREVTLDRLLQAGHVVK